MAVLPSASWKGCNVKSSIEKASVVGLGYVGLPTAAVLASRGIVTMEDLAEQAVDDLLDIEEMTEERAAEVIMTARAPWFAEEEEATA